MRQKPGGPDGSFEERLKAARSRRGLDAPSKPKGFDPNGVETSLTGIGLRVGIELVAALVVAVAIGYGLDWLFGTKPILTAVFVPVGGAAGVWNVWRVFAPKSGQG
ncbi:MAG: AtpZ/AtpI family protein [Acetobacteraceae bacterium]|nr:AtpZ/AtpI family protein [Acetobacteraceae bacterium]